MCMAILTCTLDSLNLLAIEAWDLFKNVVVCINLWSNIHKIFWRFPLMILETEHFKPVGSTLNTWWIPSQIPSNLSTRAFVAGKAAPMGLGHGKYLVWSGLCLQSVLDLGQCPQNFSGNACSGRLRLNVTSLRLNTAESNSLYQFVRIWQGEVGWGRWVGWNHAVFMAIYLGIIVPLIG